MSKKKNNCYFEAFIELADYSKQAAELLNDYVHHFDLSKMDEKIKEMHEIETKADSTKHEMMDRLSKEFITPIEREDINHLFNVIENVSDTIEDVLIKMHIFCISEMRPEAKEFANIIVKCCESLKKMMMEFPNYKKSTQLQKYIIEINDLEEEGDKLYTGSVHNLFSISKDPIELLTWTETMDQFEKSCDSIEHVAIVVESVVMNNI